MNNSDRFQTNYESTRALGLVNTQHEFSRLCGRKASWFSASKSVDRELSLAALITLTKALECLPSDQLPRNKRAKLKQLTRTLWLMIEAKDMTPVK
jgi:hypothetical protein